MLRCVLFVFTISFSLPLLASDAVSGQKSSSAAKSKATSGSSIVKLGDCKPQVDPTTQSEEAFARKLAEQAGLSKEELLARLIYSEALSTGYWKGTCNAKSAEDIFTNIGWGIMHRVRGKAKNNLDAYSEVIFGKSQFRTSFSGKKPNPFAEAFLCPLGSQKYFDGIEKKVAASELYAQSQEIAMEIIAEYEKSGIPKKASGITNFFYPHSEFFGEIRPSWAPDKEATKNRGYVNLLEVKEQPCVEFYRLK